MKYLFLILALLPLYGLSADLNIKPVYGFQRNYQAQPKPARYRTEVFLGVSATYGTKLLALEGEMTQANSDNSVTDSEVKSSTQSLMAGLRLTPISGKYYNIFMRGGARLQNRTTTVKQNGVSSTTTIGPDLDPYAGTGIGINVGGLFTLNASATLIYNRNADPGEQYDTRYTLGAGISFNQDTNFGDL